MKITIKDIAKKTNFSAKTVSRVLNNDPMVRDNTRAMILETIKKYGYRPNIIARSLRQQKTNMIGFIIPDVLNVSFPTLFKGASDVFEKNGYYSFLSSSDNNIEKEYEFIRDFNSMLISGMVLIPAYSMDRDVSIFNSLSTPIVIVDRELEYINKDTVIISNRQGAYDATKYLIRQGHKKIAILAAPLKIKSARKRLEGWENAMKENRLYSNDLIFSGEFSIASGHSMMKSVFDSIKKVDAVFASNDYIAIGAMRAIEEKGMKIPQDISIIGFDDIYFSQYLKPSLSTVAVPLYEEGRQAAEILLERINGNTSKEVKRIVLESSLVIRESVSRR